VDELVLERKRKHLETRTNRHEYPLCIYWIGIGSETGGLILGFGREGTFCEIPHHTTDCLRFLFLGLFAGWIGVRRGNCKRAFGEAFVLPSSCNCTIFGLFLFCILKLEALELMIKYYKVWF